MEHDLNLFLFHFSILYETDADFVTSGDSEKSSNKANKNKDNNSSTRRCKLPKLKSRCKLAIVGFDNINFKPFHDDTGTTSDDPTTDEVDLVMEECPIDDDREPIIAHMV